MDIKILDKNYIEVDGKVYISREMTDVLLEEGDEEYMVLLKIQDKEIERLRNTLHETRRSHLKSNERFITTIERVRALYLQEVFM